MKKLIYSLFAFPLLFACSTMVPVEVMKPAEINMGTMKTIAILDFGYPDLGYGDSTLDALILNTVQRRLDSARAGNSDQELAADYATRTFISLLDATGRFSVKSPLDVANAVTRLDRHNVSPAELAKAIGADALLSAAVTYLHTDVLSSARQHKDPHGVFYYVTTYTKKAELELSYRIINAHTGRVVAEKRLEGDETREATNPDNLPDARSMYESILDRIMSAIPRRLVPSKVTEFRALMADRTNDGEMKRLDRLAREKNYSAALSGYLAVWKNKRNEAAGYNAAILLETAGDVDGALALMSEVADATRSDRALEEIERLRRMKAEKETAAARLQ